MNPSRCLFLLCGIFASAAALGQVPETSDPTISETAPTTEIPAEVYNRGVRLYREGKILEAAECFRQAAAAADSSLASRARYNLGNTHYARAVELLRSGTQPDPEAAVTELQSAIVNYRSALRIDRDDTDARANIELASQLIQQIRDQQQQQQDQQQSQQNQDQSQQQDNQQQQQDGSQDNQQQSENQDQSNSEQHETSENEQNSDQQTQQQEQEQSDTNEQDQQTDESDSEGSPEDESQSESGEEQQESESQSSESDQPNEPSPSDQANPGDRDSDAQDSPNSSQRSNQSPAGGEPDGEEQQDPQEASESDDQTSSQGELSAANEDEQSPDAMSRGAVPQQAMQLTEEEARKMLQSIRDRDMIRRLRRQAARAKRRIPVERDW